MSEKHVEIRPRSRFRDFVLDLSRWSVIIVHRRGGKSFSSLQKLVKRSFEHERKGPPKRYAYIAPTRDQAKDIAWNYLKAFVGSVPGAKINESELLITFVHKMPDGSPGRNDGMSFRLYSGDNYERMRGLYFDGVIIDEPEDIDPIAWPTVIRPTLTDYQGWAVWIGTVKGKHGIWKRFCEAKGKANWFTMLLKASESGIIPQEELDDIRHSPGMTEDAYLQEYECDPNVGRPGAIYAKEVAKAEAEGRICEFQPHRGALVHTSWDLGSPENTAVTYFQRIGPELRIIDYDKGLRLTTGERVAYMLQKGYNYGTHCLPHDANAERTGGLSFAEELYSAGLKNVAVIPRTNDPERRIIGMWEQFDNIWFRKSTTEDLILALDAYHRKEEKTSATIMSVIVHDWASHGADSFGYVYESEAAGIITANLPRMKGTGKAKAPKVTGMTKMSTQRGHDDDDDDEPIRVSLGTHNAPKTISYGKIRVSR